MTCHDTNPAYSLNSCVLCKPPKWAGNQVNAIDVAIEYCILTNLTAVSPRKTTVLDGFIPFTPD